MAYDKPIGETPLDLHAANGVVGKPIDRVDGRLKVSGRATYAAEYAGEGKTAYGVALLSTIAKGRIADIDTSVAEAMPGVVTVLTYRNANPPEGQGKRVSSGPTSGKRSFPQLADDRIGYAGQPIALAVAETFEQARAASMAVRVRYAPEDARLDMEARIGTAVTPKEQKPDSRIGDFDGAFAAAPVKLDVTYTTPDQVHAMMEPHATIATWKTDGLTLYTSNQIVFAGAAVVANTLNLQRDEVRMVSRYVGGGFGGKLDVWPDAILAALASRALRGRAVKVVLTRQQMFGATGHRPQTLQHIRLGADADGRIQAVAHEVWTDNNPDETFFEGSAKSTRSLYAGANRLTTHRLIQLDIPVGNSMRAPGEASGMLAMECAMDELAEKLNLDPVELRIRNNPAEDPELKVPYSSRNLVELMQQGAERFGWSKRNPKHGQVRDGRWLVGHGMAAALRNVAFQHCKAQVVLNPDGTLVARTAMTDVGTGTYTILTQIAAEMMGLPVEKVTVQIGDSGLPGGAGVRRLVRGAILGFRPVRGVRGPAGQAGPRRRRRPGDRAVQTAGGWWRGQHVPHPGGARERQHRHRRGRDRAGQADEGLLDAVLRRAHFAEVGRRHGHGRDQDAPHAGHLLGRAHPKREDRPLAVAGRHDDGGLGAALHEDAVMDQRTGNFVNKEPGRVPRAGPCGRAEHRGRHRPAARRGVEARSRPRGRWASWASAARAPRSPTPSTMPAACGCGTIRLTLDKIIRALPLAGIAGGKITENSSRSKLLDRLGAAPGLGEQDRALER